MRYNNYHRRQKKKPALIKQDEDQTSKTMSLAKSLTNDRLKYSFYYYYYYFKKNLDEMRD